MDVWTSVKSVFVGEAPQRIYAAIPPDHVSPFKQEKPFQPDKAYLRIWINDMFLNHRRVLYQTRYPLVHAFCRFLYRGRMEEVPTIAGTSQIDGLTSALDRVLNLNYRLIGPIPFRGGEVEILLGLVAVEAAEYASQLLDVLGSLSDLTGRGELKLALQFLQPLKRGVEGLFGLQKVRLHLGVHDTFTTGESSPNQLCPGYRAVIDARQDQVDQSRLWVKQGRLCTGPSLEAARPFEETDYLLFYIERMNKRDDLSALDSIQGAWDETISKATSGAEEDIDLAFQTFRGIVLQSPDLIWSDQVRLIDGLSKKVRQIVKIRSRRRFTAVPLETGIEQSLAQGVSIAEAELLDRAHVLQMSWH